MRRKIALLRGYLREGVDAEIAVLHIRHMVEAEAELRRIEDRDKKP